MADVSRDLLGQRGEWIFSTLMTKYLRGRGFLFRPHFLGDKWPRVDFIVELLDTTPAILPFFFVQVKATATGYTVREKRLNVAVPEEDIRGLAAYPAPTYVAGIDEQKERGFLVSANGENLTSLSSLSTAFPINAGNRRQLWDEGDMFWRQPRTPGLPKLSSAFVDPHWK